jgi:hypothetical protein
LKPDETDVEIRGYAQSQAAMIYTKREAQEWLGFRPEHGAFLAPFMPKNSKEKPLVIAHVRRGDFGGYGYPLVSLSSYEGAIAEYRLNAHLKENFEVFCLVSELCPRIAHALPSALSFLPDFLMLANAPVLLRANSSFSWLAGLLSTGRVFSPVIDGLEGGREHDCKFVEGNWPRLSNLAGCTDLHVAP